jgi:hypothetical protein
MSFCSSVSAPTPVAPPTNGIGWAEAPTATEKSFIPFRIEVAIFSSPLTRWAATQTRRRSGFSTRAVSILFDSSASDLVSLTSTETRSLGTPLRRSLVAHFVNILPDGDAVGEAETRSVGTAEWVGTDKLVSA